MNKKLPQPDTPLDVRILIAQNSRNYWHVVARKRAQAYSQALKRAAESETVLATLEERRRELERE